MINRNTLAELIAACNLQEIFIEHLGWDRAKDPMRKISVQFAEEPYIFQLSVVAQKRSFAVCHAHYQGTMPPKSLRRKLEAQLLRNYHEHLLILQDAQGEQVWIYTRKHADKPDRFTEISAQQPQLVIDKLLGLVFSISEEDGLNIINVIERTQEQFSQNAKQVTRNFYDKFGQHLEKFSEFVKGVEDRVKKEHYASLMLNRLMFIYFIQKKGCLNGEKDYLRDRLKTVQQQHGKDKFYETFYRSFLRKLFHRLSVPPQDAPPDKDGLIGKVPYLNGGLFDEHKIEKEHDNIKIADEAFKRIFDFFDTYQWYLDDRPVACKNEINPDVMGYIFEKYINERAKMGAYYTKEDITGYIARNTILPALLQKAKVGCKEAFDSESGTIWKLLRENPDDYIYESVRRGCEKADSELPEEIRRGLNPKTDALLESRADWNKEAGGEFTLPSETWRECIARRTRYFALKQKIKNRGITDIADLTTHNLNIEKLTADTIEWHEGTDFISAFYYAIAGRQKVEGTNITERRGLTVLDPACGSGAFLFTALNVLQSLYLGCLARMRNLVEEDDILMEKTKRKKKHEEYRLILDEIKKHPSEEYWICRNIILHNLFGVDIMPDAVEVAKLRLFLKLAAESEVDNKKPNMGLEPLPDIDFNIRAGNSLVGFSSMAEFERVASDKLKFSHKLIKKIKDETRIVGMTYKRFIEAQDDGQYNTAKTELSERLEKLNEKLNTYLSQIEGVDCGDTRPFHWFAEFYGVIEVENEGVTEKSGGFDVVFGNPPYVEEKKVSYKLPNFVKAKGNLYAFLIEKSVQTLHPDGAFGMIVPISLPSTNRMEGVRNMLRERFPFLYAANFADRPGTLFNGVHQKVTIVMGHSGKKGGFYTTNFLHWSNKNERQELFDGLHYQQNNGISDRWGKFGNEVESRIWQKLQNSERMHCFYKRPSEKRNAFYINKRLMFWVKSCVAPKTSKEFLPYGAYNLPRETVVAMLNSSIFFWFWEVVGDGWDLTQYELEKFNFGVREKDVQSLADLGTKLEADLEAKKRYVGTRQTEYEYVHANSKKIIDEIDKILAKHYGFTDEELDYIINYDYKYRMSGAE